MLLGAALALLPCGALAAALRGRAGSVAAFAFGALVWSVVVIGLVTLVPAEGAPGIVAAEDRLTTCGEIGGPAPDGFWIFTSGQRLLNTALFVPSGLLLVVAAARLPRTAPLLVVAGVAALAAYSVGIEYTQLELARIDRACDLTDVVDNVTGAGLGVLLGLPVALALRPWRSRG